MASAGNFPTMNPHIQSGGSGDDKSSGYVSNGSLKVNVFKSRCGAVATIGMRTSGKYYFEVYVNYYFGGTNVAIVNESWNLDAMPGYQIDSQNTSDYDVCGYYFENGKLNNALSAGDGNNFTNYGSGLTNGSVLGVAVDVDNGKIWFHKDGTYPNSGNPATGANPARGAGGTITTAMDFSKTWYVTAGGWGQTTGIITYNFGQDSTFGGEITAGGNQDSNSQGDFKHSVPSGFTCLSSNNVPISDDIDPAQTDTDYPSKQFNVVTYTGTGSSNAITGLGFKPDLVWLKQRNSTNSNKLIDSTRGATYAIESDTTQNSSSAESNGLTAFGTDGFTVGSDSAYNGNSSAYVAWCWRANSGVTSSNSDGDITSTVQANTKAGFSIVKWTSNNQSNQDIGHGLGVAPRFIISKPYSASTWSWHVFHHYLGSIGKFQLNGTAAFSSGTNTYGAMPTSSVFRVGTPGNLMPNNTDTDVISYCFHDVESMQRFGSYVGNGSNDGPTIYTSFRPRLFIQKRADSTGDWRVWDSARHTFNTNDAIVRWNTSGAEDTANASCDFLSNGVKLRVTYADVNADGGKYIYMCFGDVPFRYNNLL